jgi:glycosyltransferase involved in cell wall biosynthesis
MEAISVIIPTYNRARYIDRAIRSAIAATDAGDEIIIVDDGSTDDTALVVSAWGERVRYFRFANGGAGAARNHGIRLSTKPLVAFLDSDDEWFPHKLALQRAFMAARPNVLFCFSDFAFQDEKTGRRDRMYLRNWHTVRRGWDELLGPGVPYSAICSLPEGCDDFPVHEGNLYPPLIEGPFVAAWTSVIRREKAGDAFRFEEGVKICEDWWCYARLARRGTAAFFACETACNHGHDGPRVTDANKYDMLTNRLRMTEELWGQDAAFRREHGKLYEQIVNELRHERARWFLGRGRKHDARLDLLQVRSGALLTRLLLEVPVPLVLVLAAFRRLVARLIRSTMLGIPLVLANVELESVGELVSAFA